MKRLKQVLLDRKTYQAIEDLLDDMTDGLMEELEPDVQKTIAQTA